MSEGGGNFELPTVFDLVKRLKDTHGTMCKKCSQFKQRPIYHKLDGTRHFQGALAGLHRSRAPARRPVARPPAAQPPVAAEEKEEKEEAVEESESDVEIVIPDKAEVLREYWVGSSPKPVQRVYLMRLFQGDDVWEEPMIAEDLSARPSAAVVAMRAGEGLADDNKRPVYVRAIKLWREKHRSSPIARPSRQRDLRQLP